MHDEAKISKMRMRVKLSRLSVRRPASMSDRNAKALRSEIFHLFFEIIKLADCFEVLYIRTLIHHGKPSAVISAILEFFQSVYYDFFLLFISYVAYDSTHFAFLI